MAIILNLTEKREAKGFSQNALAKASGIPQPRVNQYESGNITPSITALYKLSIPLECEWHELITVEGDEKM